ncbi:uncharacterized protein BJ212DRAFT_1294645 [Suillus subaureus]|uniref:Uncharacterized protein n=1 Tax=Suillus subaureus TaxID=48587 RepID=A0A9P7EQJ4_9AGAM|nr:uncharacterized protein BJ212DRAFT_1294645 [Suillus subaureus]KAG1827348.1 hypothetical protein BJ212DRAFT_1294645 [Suillus subaureus]
MILVLSSQPLKSAMKTHKHAKSSCFVKSKPLMESEDEEDMSIQVVMKKPFGPATVITSSHLAVIKPSQLTPKTLVQALLAINAGDILIPGLYVHSLTQPTEQPMPGLHQAKLALHNLVGQEDQESITLGVTAVTTPKTQTHGRSKTITAIKAPAPAPASLLSSSSAVPASAPSLAVPAAALNLPMPDLHAMAIVIQDGAAHIAILEAHVAEQDGKIDTLQCLHEGLRHEIINQHPTFPIPKPPANATSLLLDQSIPVSMSPFESALPPLIDLSMREMMPTPLKFKDASAIKGLLFEYNQVVQPEVPDMSSKIVDPEYDSSNDMDVEVKVEASSEEVDMAT